MIAALATFVFLVAGWAALYAVIVGLDDSGAKILAAFRGDSVLAREPVALRPVTVRFSPRSPALRSQRVSATVEWRAAA